MSTAHCVLMISILYRPGYDHPVTESVTEDVSGNTEEDGKGAAPKTSVAGPNSYSKHKDKYYGSIEYTKPSCYHRQRRVN